MHREPTPGEIALHDLLNDLSGVRIAVQAVARNLKESNDREMLNAALARIDKISAGVPKLIGVEE